ncbi:thiamine phosphate synthase [Pedobacter sp. MR2016-24]|uniref:thiamine phosphate synthase n=1 Tax=Pedobacter sp. MR2016-24 TaxID=2994466 RepID=UPI002245BFBD|nr:thiamine phosphate synthase [Pedobacter sp. MR2016-24]MCX2486451.1 thiamine phosphate synthase [Pedobacter sp. MR2016-24]
MSTASFPYHLYLVISEEACLGKDMIKIAEQAVKGGVDLVQLREKNNTDETFLLKALQIKEMLDKYAVPLIINDNLNVAMQCAATGIHVGNSDIPPSRIKFVWPACPILGYSIEYIEQLEKSDAQLADYLGISPVFSTLTKIDTVTEWGLSGITSIRTLTSKPLVAIGNINSNNAREVIDAGADCLAVVSAICSAANPGAAAERIRNEIEKSSR